MAWVEFRDLTVGLLAADSRLLRRFTRKTPDGDRTTRRDDMD